MYCVWEPARPIDRVHFACRKSPPINPNGTIDCKWVLAKPCMGGDTENMLSEISVKHESPLKRHKSSVITINQNLHKS